MDDRPLSPAGEVPVMPLRQSHRRAKSVRSSAHAPNPSRPVDKRSPPSLSHRPVGELTNPGVGAMGLKRGRPVQFHRPLVGPRKGRLPLLVPWGLGQAPRGLATAP